MPSCSCTPPSYWSRLLSIASQFIVTSCGLFQRHERRLQAYSAIGVPRQEGLIFKVLHVRREIACGKNPEICKSGMPKRHGTARPPTRRIAEKQDPARAEAGPEICCA